MKKIQGLLGEESSLINWDDRDVTLFFLNDL